MGCCGRSSSGHSKNSLSQLHKRKGWEKIFDETTIVEAEEYSSVLSKQSYVRYADAKITDVYEMSKIVSSEFVEQRDKFPANLLLRI